MNNDIEKEDDQTIKEIFYSFKKYFFIMEQYYVMGVTAKSCPSSFQPPERCLFVPTNLIPFNKQDEIKTPLFLSGITIDHKDDIDMMAIDRIIRDKFDWEQNVEIKQLQIQLKTVLEKTSKHQDSITSAGLEKRKNKLQKKITKITDKTDQTKYAQDVKEIIEQYIKLGATKKRFDFITNNIIDNETSERKKSRSDIVDKYLKIAEQYIPIDVIRSDSGDDFSCQCGFDLRETYNPSSCPQCGLTQQVIVKYSNYCITDSSKTETENYTPTENLKKAMDKFQGKVTNIPIESIATDLDKYFTSKGFDSATVIRQKNLDERGYRGNTNPQMIFEGLKETKNSSYYDDFMYIGQVLWGWQPRDISKYEQIILENDRKIRAEFDNIPKKRQTSLNVWFRLYKHLEILGYKCQPEDFKLPKEISTRGNHETLWAEAVRRAKLPYYQTYY